MEDEATAGSGQGGVGSKEDLRIGSDVDDEAQEGHAPRLFPDPGRPTAQQRAIHEAIHIPFRSRCRECVLGRGRDRQHRRIEDEDGVPRVSRDYMFFTEYGVFTTIDEAEASIRASGGLRKHCLAVMVLKDFKYNRLWVYPGVKSAES